MVGLFAAPLRDLVGVIDARIRQLEEQGETVPEPEAAAEEPQAEEAAREEAAAEEEQPEEPSAEAEVASADEEEEQQDG